MANKKFRESDKSKDEFHCEEIDYNEIEIVQLIGKGSFGSVYKANWRNDVVAVKALAGLQDKGPLVEVRISAKYLKLLS